MSKSQIDHFTYSHGNKSRDIVLYNQKSFSWLGCGSLKTYVAHVAGIKPHEWWYLKERFIIEILDFYSNLHSIVGLLTRSFSFVTTLQFWDVIYLVYLVNFKFLRIFYDFGTNWTKLDQILGERTLIVKKIIFIIYTLPLLYLSCSSAIILKLSGLFFCRVVKNLTFQVSGLFFCRVVKGKI